MAKKLTKSEKAQRRFDKFMTPARLKAIDKFLEKWDDLDDGHVWNLRNQLFDDIQDSIRPGEMRKQRDQYLIALYKFVEKERKLLTKSFPYEVK